MCWYCSSRTASDESRTAAQYDARYWRYAIVTHDGQRQHHFDRPDLATVCMYANIRHARVTSLPLAPTKLPLFYHGFSCYRQTTDQSQLSS